MIKAEVISHEGNPGPNWLDHCRSIATPLNIVAFLMVLVAAAVLVSVSRHDDITSANQQDPGGTSQPAAQSSLNPLQVAPLSQSVTTTNGSANVQSAAGGQKPISTPVDQSNSASALGATSTPALNSTSKPNSSNGPTQAIQDQVRSTVDGVQSTVNKTVNGLLNPLGL